MKQLRLSLGLLFIATISSAQQTNFVLHRIKFKGLEFSTTKEMITKSFGQGKKVDTNYDCGFFVNDQAKGPYYQLVYSDFNYIGSDKDNFYLQSVNFDSKGKTKLHVNSSEINGLTTKVDFSKIFGNFVEKYFQENPDKDSILIFSKDADDGVIFTFKNNRLIKFEYWTPC